MNLTHSYYPVGAEIPNYISNQRSTLALVSTFAVTCSIVLTAATLIATKVNPRIRTLELSKVLWFTLCGSIHFFLEGYYARNFATLAGSHHFLAQLWKEYSMSDSRYLTSDAFVMCMESITAWCWGPLSFILAAFIVTDNPFRHPLQIVISTGQLYGDVLYYGTFVFDSLVYGIEYSRPEGYYFYGYFVLLNGFWIVIPSCESTLPPLIRMINELTSTVLVADSMRACGTTFAEVKKLRTAAKKGAAKKMA